MRTSRTSSGASSFVSPTEAIDLICRGPARATVAITFDDGYLD